MPKNRVGVKGYQGLSGFWDKFFTKNVSAVRVWFWGNRSPGASGSKRRALAKYFPARRESKLIRVVMPNYQFNLTTQFPDRKKSKHGSINVDLGLIYRVLAKLFPERRKSKHRQVPLDDGGVRKSTRAFPNGGNRNCSSSSHQRYSRSSGLPVLSRTEGIET